MKRFVLFVLVAGLVLAVGSAWALTLQPNVSTWQSWDPDTDLDENGTPYWDGNSSDYNPQPANIGYWLTKTGAWDPTTGIAPPTEKAKSPGVAYPYLGNPDGSAIADIYFQTVLPNWAAIQIEVAGLKNLNYFGVYKQGTSFSNLDVLLTPGGNPGDTWKLVFTGAQGPNASTTFVVPWSDFGFYLATETGVGTGVVARAFFSESSLNSVDHNLQHFAFFRVKPIGHPYPAYYIGVEDLPNLGDKDYQDLVVFIQAVPDASTLMLFLSGVPALALLRRKRA
jgi:hypothetical protein